MADLVYQHVMRDLKTRIRHGEFKTKKLPDERSLSESYQVSRSTIKRAMGVLVDQGIIFKKRGSGTFINPLYLKDQSAFRYEGKNLGITDSFQIDGERPKIKLLDYQVIRATPELQQDLFLKEDEFVYQIKRLRSVDDQPVIIETGYIPIKIVPTLTAEVVQRSIFNYIQEAQGRAVNKSFLSIRAQPSNAEDQDLLALAPNEPVGVMEGIFFLDDGTPFEVSNMHLHYKYLKYGTFVNLNED
ncbi:GntR family transcriptional regulator [Levilactobacillus namurensis]|uniref:GntR family transcriptional regulator n=1 Tax=Levilactobacillus namurensis TaxID=380393 RepID=UPI00222F7A7C|nr:GntR family transcriptional regulator [Levilactobacillus namurensis]MCW3778129.1 GntR family transcriptional regulator [Levilactobacillus namurensis]MDT7018114.1 GntR family transcriptional regulator [Levilactobacillus namurensis]WNN64897.1 GntR family transcriptional regulator [Levilactobacillus namurensis]